jgi:DNA polymerase (family 10)
MLNKEVTTLLDDIALLLDLAGESPFKGRAYTNVARQIERLEDPIENLVNDDRLREVKGVGDALEQKISEFVNTGRLGYYEKLKDKFPTTLFDLFGIPGLGPKRIKQVYEELQIQSLDELEEACKNGSLNALKGFGPKMQAKLLAGIEFARIHQGQFHFDKAYLEAVRLKNLLQELDCIQRIEIAGSLRRCKEVVKDVDIIVSSTQPELVMDTFVNDTYVKSITGHGTTKSSVILQSGISADLRVVSDEEFPFALAHFTGSKEHNVVMRQRAKERGLKLNEYGLFEGESLISCATEEEIFSRLDLPYLPPEIREDYGEFTLNESPALASLDKMKGVIHSHSIYSDGQNTMDEMVDACIESGYEYLVMSDHSKSAGYAGGLKEDRVVKQQKEIDAINERLTSFRLIKGIESDIRANGSLDYDEDVLKTFEIVIASVHGSMDMNEEDATNRLIKAVENPYTSILGHPTGRLLLQRQGFPLKYDKLFDACAANRVAVEINANCRRLDLDWRYVRQARDKGVKLCISPDAHSTGAIDYMQYGIGIARKGWLTDEDLLNSLNAEALIKWFAKA